MTNQAPPVAEGYTLSELCHEDPNNRRLRFFVAEKQNDLPGRPKAIRGLVALRQGKIRDHGKIMRGGSAT
jgi:hypothetical protein